jgi:hypothetical protein
LPVVFLGLQAVHEETHSLSPFSPPAGRKEALFVCAGGGAAARTNKAENGLNLFDFAAKPQNQTKKK